MELKYFRVYYSYTGGKAHTVTSGKTLESTWRVFQRDNRHVAVTKVEDDAGAELTTPPPA